jgi:aminoglycoside phosphotransferase (APT) family kinase protein
MTDTEANDLAGLVDVAALETFLNEKMDGPATPITVKKHTAGYSNVTLFIDRGDEKLVMRRPPTGEPVALGARCAAGVPVHLGGVRAGAGAAADRELRRQGRDRAPFYVMERMAKARRSATRSRRRTTIPRAAGRWRRR